MTLRFINRLKQQKKQREAELAKKELFLAAMYGDPYEQMGNFENELAREQDRHEIEMLKQEVELLKDQIAVQIDAAEIDAEQKERIAQGAMRAIKRKNRKNQLGREREWRRSSVHTRP
jgi:hypothetical protein